MRLACSALFSARRFLARFEHLDRVSGHDCRDSVFIDELGVPIPSEQKTKVIEPADEALQFDAVYEKYCHRGLGLPNMVQERILKILCFFAGHEPIPFVLGRLCAAMLLLTPHSPDFFAKKACCRTVARPACPKALDSNK
jgi:hypothetical protein